MKIEFYLPKYLIGGGELITLSLIKCLNDTEPNIKLKLYCENSKKIKNLEKKILRELSYSNKFLLINKLILNFARSFLLRKTSIHVSVLSGMIIFTGLVNLIFMRKLICIEHSNLDKFYFKNKNFIKKYMRVFLYNLSLLSTYKLVFVSHKAMSDSLKKIWRINKKKVTYIDNPIFNIKDKIKLSYVKKNHINTFLIIGRFSSEKRIDFAIDYLSKQNLQSNVIVVSEIEKEIIMSSPNLNKVKIYSSYYKLPKLNINETILLNFSLVESFSLIIGEWLQAGGLVFSTKNSACNSIWANYKGFYKFQENGNFKNQIDVLNMKRLSDKRLPFKGKNILKYKKEFLNII